MAEVVCEGEGFAGASIAAVCARAKVSGKAFYDTFESRESCFLAALDEGHRRCTELVHEAFEQTDSWLDGVRLAQAELLVFFDSDPQLARVCVVESLAAGTWALKRREQHVKALTNVMIDYWAGRAPEQPYPHAGEGVVTSTLGVIQGHLQARNPEPLRGLLGPLMGLTTAPYLDAREVAEEVERAGELARELLARRNSGPGTSTSRAGGVPPALLDPRAHRARQCVRYLATHAGASNRQVAKAIGIAGHAQISALLARLATMDLAEKLSVRPGHPNAWSLTGEGVAVAKLLERVLGDHDNG